MGLFSKEACTFCGKEVGLMHRSKLQTKEYICNDCRNRTNPFARMDYTSRDDAQRMMDTMGSEQEWLNNEIDRLNAERTSPFAVVDETDFNLGGKRVVYRHVHALGAFQLYYDALSHYEYNAVLFLDKILPYQFDDGNDFFADARRHEVMDLGANYVTVSVSKDPDGNITGAEVVIPYQDNNIREIKLSGSVSSEADCKPFYELAERINRDRRSFIEAGLSDEMRKNRMQLRNLGDTAAAAIRVAAQGGDVAEVAKAGIQTANAIEEGKVKQGLFGKLFRK